MWARGGEVWACGHAGWCVRCGGVGSGVRCGCGHTGWCVECVWCVRCGGVGMRGGVSSVCGM